MTAPHPRPARSSARLAALVSHSAPRPGARTRGIAAWLTCSLLAGLVCAPSARAGTALPRLTPAQVGSLGIQTAATVAAPGAWMSFPAEIVVPAAQQRVVAAPAAGLVEALNVSPGERVQAGQVLARLRSTQSGELQRDVLQTRSQLDLAQRQLTRDEALFAEGLIPQSRLEAARAQVQQARAMASERQSALQVTTGQATPDSQGMLNLRAPIGGQVLEQMAAVGQRVDAMAPLYRMASLQPLWVDIQVPAREASGIRPGDAVQLPLPGAGQLSSSARVVHLGATVDARSQTLVVRARIDEPKDKAGAAPWRPGQILQAQVQRVGQGQAVTLPSSALLPQPGGVHQVFVARSAGQFEMVNVTVLTQQAEQATVSGLPAGTNVVVRGTAALKALVGASDKP